MSSKKLFILIFKFKNVQPGSVFSVQMAVFSSFYPLFTDGCFTKKLELFRYPLYLIGMQIFRQLSCQYKKVVRKSVQVH
jgi:hypothetical protein